MTDVGPSMQEVACPLDCLERHIHHHFTDNTGTRWVHPGIPLRCEVCIDWAAEVERTGDIPDPVVSLAHELLSSLEAWSSTPRDHRADTPARFISMLREMTTRDPEFKFTTFDEDHVDEMITMGPIPFYTLCAHHVVPFLGNCWIGYVPDGRIAGLSKFPRAVKYLAKGFWVQETLTTEIADFLEAKLNPKGVAVVMEAEHMCMAMRGIQQAGIVTRTSAMRGVFADHDRTAKAEFMAGINGH